MARLQPRRWQRLFGARKPIPIMIVSGLPRSGTSMLMQMLGAGGLEVMTDHRRQADMNNPRGYFEFEPVKALAEAGDTSWLDAAHGKVVKIISSLLPHLPAAKTYKILFMERNLQEVLASQHRMLDHLGKSVDATDDATVQRQFTRHLGQVKAWLREQSHIDVLYISHAEVIAAPQAVAERIQAFLRHPLQVEAMVAAVQPQLYRNRATGN
jgi:Sulfotransferase domain